MIFATLATFAAGLCLLIGSTFVVIGVYGILKFSDPMARVHAPTKVGTLGIGMLLLASVFDAFATGDRTVHELLILAFLFFTAPISANFISKVHIHKRTCVSPPPPPTDDDWATLSAKEDN